MVASWNSKAMAAKGKPFCKAQRSVQGFSAILKAATCELFLIFLMLIDALLSYALTKFAHICNLQTPCILCSRFDHLLDKEKSNNYRNLLCTNHRLEISSLVSCHKHNKLVDGNEMCDACLCSFATTNNKHKLNCKMQRLIVGKLRSDTCGNGAHGNILNRDSIPHCIKRRPCSCCSKPWKTRPNAQGLLQLKSSLNMATKPNIPYPPRLNRRDSLKKRRDKIFGSVTLQHPGKTGFNLLSHVGFSELRITSDSELEVLLSEEDDDKSFICEKSVLKEDSVLRSITQIPLKPHCNNFDQVKSSINFVDPRPSPLESYVQVDVQKPHDVESLACDASFHGLNELNWLPWPANPTANLSTWAEFISLDDASSVASNVLGLSHANSMEKSELTDSPNQESTLSCCPQFVTLHQDPQVEGKLMTSEETGTNNMGIASPIEHEDHSTSINTKVEECPKINEVVNKSSSGKTNDGTDHSSDSESSESDKEHEVNLATRQASVSSSGNTNDDFDHNSDSESSKSDNEHKVNFASRQPSKSSSGNTNDDSNHNTEETGRNNMGIASPIEHGDHSTLINTKVEECPKIDEVTNESSSGKTNDGTDHNSDSESSSESSESDKEHEVNLATRQALGSSSGNTNDDSDHNSDSESSKSDKEHKVNFASRQPLESSSGHTNNDSNHNCDSVSSDDGKDHEINFATRHPLEKEADIVSNDMKQPPLISISVKECLKIDEVVHESAIKNTNDGMDHNSANKFSESSKEQEVFNFTVDQPLDKEIDTVTNDLKQSPMVNITIEECPKIDGVAYVSANRNTNYDMDHNSVSEFESDKEREVSNFAIGQSLEKEIDIITDDLKQTPLINTTVEECSKTDVVAYEFSINNINDDMVSVNVSTKSDKEHEILNFSLGQSLEKETHQVTNDLKQPPLISTTIEECTKTDEVANESAIKNTKDDMDNISESTEGDKEHEIFNFSEGRSLENEADVVANDLKHSQLISTTVEECSKTDEVAYEFTIKNINDDMDRVSGSVESDKGHAIFSFSLGQSSEKETDLGNDDLKQSLLISTTTEKCSTTEEVVYESAIMNTNDNIDHTSIDEVTYGSAIMNSNDDMDHNSVSESSVNDKQQEVFNFTTEKPSKTELDIVTNDMEQFPLQENPAELVNRPFSDDEGHNFSISYDDLQEDFASRFNIIPTFHRSVSMESVESQDGSNVSEIEGESIVDRLKRQVEYDKKCINSLYKELEEERSASEVAASQAMAMITRLQEEKAAMHMEALHYLRMMEEQAEYDVEALEKANELLNEKERDIQDLEAELEYYRSNYMVNTIAETEHEKSDGANEENITAENESVEHHEYNGNYSFKSTMAESSKGSYRSFNNQNSSLEFEDEKVYIQLCLKSLEDKINKVFTNGLLARVPNSTDNGEEVNPEQKEEESIDAERSQRNNEDNGPSKHIDQNNCNGTVTPEGELVDADKNGHFSSDENFYDVKSQISFANKREEVDFFALEHKISDITGKLEALQAGYDFLEHSLNSLRYGEEGLQFAQDIVHQLQELCKLGIILDRQSGS